MDTVATETNSRVACAALAITQSNHITLLADDFQIPADPDSQKVEDWISLYLHNEDLIKLLLPFQSNGESLYGHNALGVMCQEVVELMAANYLLSKYIQGGPLLDASECKLDEKSCRSFVIENIIPKTKPDNVKGWVTDLIFESVERMGDN